MGGFLAINSEGLRACKDATEVAALVWLHQQADLYGWGLPFECSTTDVIEQTRSFGKGRTRGWVTSFLRRLERLGVVDMVKRGDRRTTRVLSVPSPFPQKAVQDGEQVAEQVAEHRKHRQKPTTKEVGTGQRTGQRTGRPSFIDQDQEQRTKIKILSVVFEKYADHHEALARARGAAVRRRRSKPRGMKERVNEHGQEAALLVLEWAFTSRDQRAIQLRDGNHLTDTLFRPSKFEEYLTMADAWKVRGQPFVEEENDTPAPAVVVPAQDLQALKQWRPALKKMETYIGAQDVNIWLDKCVAVELSDSTLTLWTPESGYSEWIREHYHETLERLIAPRNIKLIHPDSPEVACPFDAPENMTWTTGRKDNEEMVGKAIWIMASSSKQGMESHS